MLLIDPILARLEHQERLRQAAERHLVELARADQTITAPRWFPRLLPRRLAGRVTRTQSRAA